MALLSDSVQRQGLTELKGWTLEGKAIAKKYKFKDFQEAIAFLVRVGFLAEAADHHPDITNSYSRVTLSLSTHSAGGLTEKDFALARQIDGLTPAG